MSLTVQRTPRAIPSADPAVQVVDVPLDNETIRIVCISDTHGEHEAMDIPPGDILVHAGDFSPSDDPIKRRQEVEAFDAWLASLPHAHKIVIAGNHDLIMAKSGARKFITAAHYLESESVEVMGLVFFGSPYTPRCGNGAFHFTRLQTPDRVWSNIPDDVDVLVTHGPPKNVLDRNHVGESVGDEVLRARVDELAPKLHVFGHVHESYGQRVGGLTTFVNAAAGPTQQHAASRFKAHQLRTSNV